MHHIQWEYEPRTFPVQWDTEGNVTQAFAPDFYLPRFDTYIELTTMDQKYVSQKKKKVRMLQKLYPDININIVFKNDFYHLAERVRFCGKGRMMMPAPGLGRMIYTQEQIQTRLREVGRN